MQCSFIFVIKLSFFPQFNYLFVRISISASLFLRNISSTVCYLVWTYICSIHAALGHVKQQLKIAAVKHAIIVLLSEKEISSRQNLSGFADNAPPLSKSTGKESVPN
jgi:hypothetical protein